MPSTPESTETNTELNLFTKKNPKNSAKPLTPNPQTLNNAANNYQQIREH